MNRGDALTTLANHMSHWPCYSSDAFEALEGAGFKKVQVTGSGGRITRIVCDGDAFSEGEWRRARALKRLPPKAAERDAWSEGEERMEAIGSNGPTGDHYAEDGMCVDGRPCGVAPESGDDAYCLGCLNYAEDSDGESALSEALSMPSKYHVRLKGAWCDVYDVLQAFGVTNPADQHAIKKMLMPGKRGHKDGIQDRREAIQSLHRAIELEDGQ